jgi:phosphatidylglycerol---prolipoprotein diacylglyceryl transferase
MLELFRNIFAPPRHLILLVIAAWVGVLLAERRLDRHHIPPAAYNNLVFYGLAAYLLGGRLFYAIEHFSAFVQSPISLFSLNVSLFDNWGGLGAALIVGYAFAQRRRLALWPTLDALTPVFALVAIGLGLSQLASGLAFGMQTTATWGVRLWGATRYPTQLYEIVTSLLIFGLIWFQKRDFRPGGEFLLFVALTSASRLFIEGFRGDSALILGGFRAAQILAWIILFSSLVGFEFLRGRPLPPASTISLERPPATTPVSSKALKPTQAEVTGKKARRPKPNSSKTGEKSPSETKQTRHSFRTARES